MVSREDLITDFYENYYHLIFGNNRGVSNWSYRFTHKALEKSIKGNFASVLEIGAGSGEHLSYVKHQFDSYIMVDKKHSSITFDDSRVRWLFQDINECNFNHETFNRILMMCVLHHLEDPYQSLQQIKSWLKPGGIFTFFLPSDPGIMNRINRKLFVAPLARRLGYDYYELFNALEHRNHYWALVSYIDSVFEGCEISKRYYPFGIANANMSLFSIWTIRKIRG